MREKMKSNGPMIRLLLAGCLCVILFVATTTSESDDNFCSAHDQGDLLVTNNSSTEIWFEYTGQYGGAGFVVYANSSWAEKDLKPGHYYYFVLEREYLGDSRADVVTKHTLVKTGSFSIFPLTTIELIYP